MAEPQEKKKKMESYRACFITFLTFQNQVADLKEMCSALKKEKAELEKKLAHIRGVCYTYVPVARTVQLSVSYQCGAAAPLHSALTNPNVSSLIRPVTAGKPYPSSRKPSG